MKKSVKIAFAGVLSALSVVLLTLGSVVSVLAYAMPILCGLLMIVLTESFDRKTAFVVFFSVSLLSLILLPDKECVLMYVLFFGYYPIIRETVNRIKSKTVRILIKLSAFNGSMFIIQIICIYVFGIPFDDFLGKWGVLILLAGGNIVFLAYEKVFDLLLLTYHRKLKGRIDKYLK